MQQLLAQFEKIMFQGSNESLKIQEDLQTIEDSEKDQRESERTCQKRETKSREEGFNKYDKHLISKYIFTFSFDKNNNIFMYIFRSFIFEVIKLLKLIN